MIFYCPCCGLEMEPLDVDIKTLGGIQPFDGYCRDCTDAPCPCEGDTSATDVPLGRGRRV